MRVVDAMLIAELKHWAAPPHPSLAESLQQATQFYLALKLSQHDGDWSATARQLADAC
jgi:hypothetical protein